MKFLLLLIIAVCQVSADVAAVIERQGRRVEIDGFLLEWNRRDARGWDSLWTWDAINTAEGAVGYFAAQNAQACTSWTFTIRAQEKTLQINVPEQTTSGAFAFDRGSFESTGVYNIEWLVPWNLIGRENVLVINAAGACGDTLETLRLSVVRENPPSARKTNYIITVCALIAALAVGYIFIHKKIKR